MLPDGFGSFPERDQRRLTSPRCDPEAVHSQFVCYSGFLIRLQEVRAGSWLVRVKRQRSQQHRTEVDRYDKHPLA